MMDAAVIAASHSLLATIQNKNRTSIKLPPYSIYKQSFNFRTRVLAEIQLDEKKH